MLDYRNWHCANTKMRRFGDDVSSTTIASTLSMWVRIRDNLQVQDIESYLHSSS